MDFTPKSVKNPVKKIFKEKVKKNVDEWVFYVIILDVLKNTQTVVLCTITQLEGG